MAISDKSVSAHDKYISLLLLLRKLGVNREILQDGKDKVLVRYAHTLLSSILSQPFPHYPVPPSADTWKDKLMAVLSIVTVVTALSLLIASVWKCLLLICSF